MRHFIKGAALSAIVAGMLAGCGGGTSTKPTVTVKPKSAGKKDVAANGGNSKKTEPAAAAGGYGSLAGKVLFTGNNPMLAPLILMGKSPRDPAVCAVNMNIPDQSIEVDANGGLANVFIFLDKAPAGTKMPAEVKPIDFDQKGCIFTTHALFAQTGQQILVKSSDAVSHNTHTYPLRNNPSNFTIKPNDQVGVPLVYEKAEREPFEVKCDIHTWMRAFHLALDHPYCAVTQKDGSFEIQDLPAGKHSLKIWHEKASGGFLERAYDATIEADKPTEVTISVDGAKFGL